MKNFERSIINYKEAVEVQTKIGYITGVDKMPYEYYDDCEGDKYKISLYVLNESKKLLVSRLYTIGEDKIDKELYNCLKKNFDSLFKDNKEIPKSNNDYYFVNAKVKLHLNEDNIIAISDVSETKYLLLNDIKATPLNRLEFYKYIAPLIEKKVDHIFEDFQKIIDDFTEFVLYERYDNDKKAKIIEKIHILENVLKKKDVY